MLIYILAYALISFAALIALCKMILHIGDMMGTCPDTGVAARAGAVTIATGFAAIGAGGLILICAMMPIYPAAMPAVFLLALGFASLCLGLGFTHAVGTLRAVVNPAKPAPAWAKPKADPAPAA